MLQGASRSVGPIGRRKVVRLFGARVAETILASGLPTASTGRTYGCKRSDQTLKNSCGTGAVHILVPAFAGTTDSRSRLLERHVDLAALLKPLRHRQVLGAHEIRIEQFRLIAVSGIAEHGHDGMTRS